MKIKSLFVFALIFASPSFAQSASQEDPEMAAMSQLLTEANMRIAKMSKQLAAMADQIKNLQDKNKQQIDTSKSKEEHQK